MEEIENSGLGPYYIDHTVGIWPQSAGGVPFNACEFQSKGDPITDLFEDLAAEQKARSTYDNILRVVKNIPEVADPIRFLRAREVVHFQRFGEALRSVQEQLDAKNFYAFNPSFDAPCKASCEEFGKKMFVTCISCYASFLSPLCRFFCAVESISLILFSWFTSLAPGS